MKKLLLFLLASTLLMSCGSPMQGSASLTLLSDQNEAALKFYKPIGGEVSDQNCIRSILFIWYGKQPNHETVLARMLDENKADVLLNARFTESSWTTFPFYTSYCATISGTPAVRK